MMKLSRRALIKDGFLAVSAGMIMSSIFSRGIASARAQSIDGSRVAQMAGDRTLIVVQMAGGNDGLNTVIPFRDPLYHQMRPTLTIPDTSVNTYRIYPDPADVDNGNARLQALMKLYNSYPETSPYAALLDTTALSAQEGSRQLHNADAQYQPAVTYPQGPFAAGLKILAEALVQGLGLRVGYVTLGGFDTHANQQTTHNVLMKSLADGLSAFYTDLSKHGKADNVVVMTWSEFGRRVEENGSQGTDHGTAAPMFVMGNTVNRGTFGEPSNLGNLDNNGNLKYTTDFRSVYATILDRWLGASSHDVLGGSFGSQNFLPQP